MRSKILKVILCLVLPLIGVFLLAREARAETQVSAITGNFDFSFADGKGGSGELQGGTLTVDCDGFGQAKILSSTPFQIVGKAGNRYDPYYTLSGSGNLVPPALSLELSPAPPGGVRVISVKNFNVAHSETTSQGIVVTHTYSFHATFTAKHKNHGSGPGTLDATVSLACRIPNKGPTPTPSPKWTPTATPTPVWTPVQTPTPRISPTPTPTIGRPPTAPPTPTPQVTPTPVVGTPSVY